MTLMDTLYDVISGIGGTLFGIAGTTLVNRRRNRHMNDLLESTRAQVQDISLDNTGLMSALRDTENRILELEQKILTYEQTSPVQKNAGQNSRTFFYQSSPKSMSRIFSARGVILPIDVCNWSMSPVAWAKWR